MNRHANPTPLLDATAPRVHIPLWLLAMITLSGTLAIYVFVPALPDVARELQASPAVVQWTVGVYIFGLGFGQLVYGPLADRFGRRFTLLAGLSLYAAASFAAILVRWIGNVSKKYELTTQRLILRTGILFKRVD